MPIPTAQRVVTWEDGQQVEVNQIRCLVCGATDLLKRDFRKRHEKHEPVIGQASPGDGRMFVGRQLTQED